MKVLRRLLFLKKREDSVYLKTLHITEIARLEQIQYRAAMVVTGALHFTSQDKLNTQLGWQSISKTF